MAVQKGRYAGIDLGKRTWEMAIITRNGKFKTNEQGDAEPEEKVTRFSGRTAAEGRLKLYEKLEARDKVALEAVANPHCGFASGVLPPAKLHA
jgi:hypothetical protein